MINFLAFLGWNPGDEREIMSLESLVEEFSLQKIQKSGAIFNEEKLDWVNQQYLKNLDIKDKTNYIRKYLETSKRQEWKINNLTSEFVNLISERIKKFSDITHLVEEGELDYFFEEPSLSATTIAWKKDSDNGPALKHLEEAIKIAGNLPKEEYNAKIIKDKLMSYAEKEGRGSVLWPLRYALSGKEKSPDMFIIAEILGKEKTLERWKKAIEKIKEDTHSSV